MFDSQKVVDANFVASFDTPYTDLCDEIVEEFEKIIDKGIELQINLFSLIGLYGRLSKEVAEILLKNNFIQWIGTDIHRSQHISLLEKANNLKTLSNSMRDNPIQNKYLAESI